MVEAVKSIYQPFLSLEMLTVSNIAKMRVFFVTTMQVNISMIVNDDEAEKCVRALHAGFFESDLEELKLDGGKDNGSALSLSQQ